MRPHRAAVSPRGRRQTRPWHRPTYHVRCSGRSSCEACGGEGPGGGSVFRDACRKTITLSAHKLSRVSHRGLSIADGKWEGRCFCHLAGKSRSETKPQSIRKPVNSTNERPHPASYARAAKLRLTRRELRNRWSDLLPSTSKVSPERRATKDAAQQVLRATKARAAASQVHRVKFTRKRNSAPTRGLNGHCCTVRLGAGGTARSIERHAAIVDSRSLTTRTCPRRARTTPNAGVMGGPPLCGLAQRCRCLAVWSGAV